MEKSSEDGLAFCFCGDRAVILDERGDRYFMLGSKVEAAFKLVFSAQPISEEYAEKLIRQGLVTRDGDSLKLLWSPTIAEVPTRSLLEEYTEKTSAISWRLPEIAIHFMLVSGRLKFRSFKQNLNFLRCRRSASKTASLDIGRCHALAAEFNSLRTLIPVRPICLRDSLLLLEFLWHHGFVAKLVFGVKLNPFAAHCWVQTDDMLLNETVDKATVFTPILVI